VSYMVADDSAETPGRCIRAKNLTPCSSNAECTNADESCSSLNDAQGQRYCLPVSRNNVDDLQQLLKVNVPGKHQAYSKLAEYGTVFVIFLHPPGGIAVRRVCWFVGSFVR